MIPKQMLVLAVAVVFLIAGCSSLPGLRVLTGQDSQENTAIRVVEELDLVMADKTGATDPSIISAADRIEAASQNVDIIEIRADAETDALVVNMLFVPPEAPQTLEGQIMRLDALRRAMEMTWLGLLDESLGSDTIDIRMLIPLPVTTLDSGPSFIGTLIAEAKISREDVAAYLAGDRNLENWYGMILDGRLSYMNPTTYIYYEGQPNHPVFLIDRLVAQTAAN